MQNILSEAAQVLCFMVVAGIALPRIFPHANLRQFLAKNKEARLKAMVHLREYKDDLQMLIKRITPDEVTALKAAAYAAASSESGSMGSFEVPRWPNEQKLPLLLTLQGLIKTAERELRLLLDTANAEVFDIDQLAAIEPLKLLACQCRIESIKSQVQECIPDLEVEAEGLVMARERIKELFAFGLSLEGLRESITFRPFLIAARGFVSVLHVLCLLRSNGRERLEIRESKRCNREIERALRHWRQKVVPQIALVCSVEIGFTCESVYSERV
jgi:hypothetical protein